jgi:hypothetical protein
MHKKSSAACWNFFFISSTNQICSSSGSSPLIPGRKEITR